MWSSDYTLRLWYLDPQDLIDHAYSIVSRDFTADERRAFSIDDDAPTCPQFAVGDS